LGERIGRVFRENLVEVHARIVDRCAGDVNKARGWGGNPRAGELRSNGCDTDDDAGDRP
jgi:hypothetical protein